MVHLIASIFLIAFLPACLADLSDQCPPRELSAPCTCSWWDPSRDDWGTWTRGKNILFCPKVSEREVITDVLTRTREYGYEFLSVLSPDIESLPASMFQIRDITRLFVRDASMRSMFDGTPVAKKLREFYAYNMKLSQPFQWDLFEGMPNLERFTFANSFSIKLDDQFVELFPKSLVRIAINNCSLSELPYKAFQTMDNLTRLTINDGGIEKLEKTMFPSQIEEFSFENQKIQEIPSDLFKDMSKLRLVYLAGNLISKLPEDTIGELLKRDTLRVFELHGNPIDCDRSLAWIASLDDSTRNKLWGECAKPEKLHGKKLKALTADDFKE